MTPEFFSKRRLVRTKEFERIKNLPRRTWSEAQLEALAEKMTGWLKTTNGEQRLRPKQALALYDLAMEGGLVGSLRVGAGKSLITMLAPTVLNPRPRVPLLILPASLISKTEKDLARFSAHWKVASFKIQSYEYLGRIGAANFFDQYTPDFIMLDEAHRAKNKKAGVTKRLLRYMHERPDTRVAVLSGTITKKSLKDAGHLFKWALKDKAPVPLHDGELDEWADALDEIANPLRRVHPGPLIDLARPEDIGETDTITARRAFRRRLSETPGFVETTGDQVACSLNVSALRYPEHPTTNQHFETLRARWETPDGWQETEAIAIWRHARELAVGMHYLWDPRPPKEWLDARRAWAKFCREILSRSRTLDTELQVVNAVKKGALCSPELAEWSRLRPTFTPVPKAHWHDDSALQTCQAWLENRAAGICWVEHTFFGEELSRRSGVPYFGAGALTSRGESLPDLAETYRSNPKSVKPIIASIAACGTGQNLQPWNANLITTGITQAADLEQLLGRTHRDGQQADEVTVEMLLGCWEHWDAWQRATAQAKANEDTYGADQKVLIATVDFPSEAEMLSLQGARWKKNVQLKNEIPFAL